MVNDLTTLGIKTAVSVWPDVSPDSINYSNMSTSDLLIRGVDGKPKGKAPSDGTFNEGNYFLDAFNPETR